MILATLQVHVGEGGQRSAWLVFPTRAGQALFSLTAIDAECQGYMVSL